MATGASREVVSNQTGIHENLEVVVRKHLTTDFDKPIADHSKRTFEEVYRQVEAAGLPLILDAGCGTGDSSRKLARDFPDHLVIGVDKSTHRLAKERDLGALGLLLVHADLTDFYRLAVRADWQLARHYLLYPNPWPKAAHLQRRWHGSPVLPDIVKLGGRLELRTNWRIYAEEFSKALELAGIECLIEKYHPQGEYISLFEKKYSTAGHHLLRGRARMDLPDPKVKK